jgi:hypothetical protein
METYLHRYSDHLLIGAIIGYNHYQRIFEKQLL